MNNFTNIKQSVLSKTVGKFGQSKQNEIKSLSENIYNDLKSRKSMATLLIGNVQSGKTSTFINVIANALHGIFDKVVILTGTTKDLDDQTFNRISEVFSLSDTFEDDNNQLFKVQVKQRADNIEKLPSSQYKEIIVLKKGYSAKKLELLKESKMNVLIIDDESDFASHNVVSKAKKQNNERSTTNGVLDNIVNDNVKYLAVTATPQSNILINSNEFNHPTTVHYIKPGEGYMGVSHFFDGSFQGLKHIPEAEADNMKEAENNEVFTTLEEAVASFVIYTTAISKQMVQLEGLDLRMNVFEKMNMMINTSHKKYNHGIIEGRINLFLKKFLEKDSYNEFIMSKLFIEQVMMEIGLDFSNANKKILLDEVRKMDKSDFEVVVLNGNAKDKVDESKHSIIIGGHKLSRGLTIKNLLITYFIVDPKVAAVDTTLQRARWFGYRDNLVGMIKLYTTKQIELKFNSIYKVEKEIWDRVNKGDEPTVDDLKVLYAKYADNILPTSGSKNDSKLVKKGGYVITSNFKKSSAKNEHEILFNIFDGFLNENTPTESISNTFKEVTVDSDSLLTILSNSKESNFVRDIYESLNLLKKENINKIRLMKFINKDGSLRYSAKKGENAVKSENNILKRGFVEYGPTAEREGDNTYSLEYGKSRVADIQINMIILNGNKYLFYKIYSFNKISRYINK